MPLVGEKFRETALVFAAVDNVHAWTPEAQEEAQRGADAVTNQCVGRKFLQPADGTKTLKV